jgi:hypothetical protein
VQCLCELHSQTKVYSWSVLVIVEHRRKADFDRRSIVLWITMYKYKGYDSKYSKRNLHFHAGSIGKGLLSFSMESLIATYHLSTLSHLSHKTAIKKDRYLKKVFFAFNSIVVYGNFMSNFRRRHAIEQYFWKTTNLRHNLCSIALCTQIYKGKKTSVVPQNKSVP